MICCQSSQNSCFSRLDPRFKLISLFILAFSFSFVSEPKLLPAMLVLTMAAFCLSGLPGSYILKRLKIPSIIVLALVFTLPVISGETPVASLGFLTITREGLAASALVAVRFLCIITLALIILGTTPVQTCVRAFQALRLPWIMADMALLVIRYIEVIGSDYRRMRTSMVLRGFSGQRTGIKTLKTMSWLIGSLVVRGVERSDRIYRAMRVRGYGNLSPGSHGFKATKLDILIFSAVIMLAALLVGLELHLGS